jgi:hypothetical protein
MRKRRTPKKNSLEKEQERRRSRCVMESRLLVGASPILTKTVALDVLKVFISS